MKTEELINLISLLKSSAGDLMSIMDDIGKLSQKMKVIAENTDEAVRIAKNIVQKAEGMLKNIPQK